GLYLHAEGSGPAADLGEKRLGEGVGFAGKHGDAARRRQRLANELDALPRYFRGGRRQARHVATRSCQAANEPCPYRIAGRSHHDRYLAGSLFGSRGWRGLESHDDVDLETHQLGRELRKQADLPFGSADVEANIPPFGMAERRESFAYPLEKR